MGQEFALSSVLEKGDNPFQVIVDIGTVTFSTTDSQAAYRTEIDQIMGGFASLSGTASLATDSTNKESAVIPLGAVTSGSITITRSSKAESGAKHSVLLFGRKFTAAP